MNTENKTTEKSEAAQREEGVLKLWQEKAVFEKTLSKEAPLGEFVFFEGPPTANAKPALHHLEARAFKDIIPRFKTMQGFHVRRKGGWDTHGLPVELQIEKKLGLQSKKDIEGYGVEKFNAQCKDSVLEYISEWEMFTDRMGYWVDKKDAYFTFNPQYMESVWNIIKTVNDKGLLYKDYKVLPWCPRCGTALSSHELAQGYEEDKDLSVTVKFKVKNPEKIGLSGDVFLLAWTTTPWTLPGNVALAVGAEVTYVAVDMSTQTKSDMGTYIVASDRMIVLEEKVEKKEDNTLQLGEIFKGSDLVGLEYQPLYPFLSEKFAEKDTEAFSKAYKVYAADFVNTTDGTGIVHTAVMYGQDDFVLGTQVGLPKYHLVKEDGHFLDGMPLHLGDKKRDLSDRYVKEVDEKGKPTVAVDIIDDLANREGGSLLFDKKNFIHQYPHCWRCKTALIYYARDSWYIRMSSLREKLLAENQGINWEPSHIKEGRFGDWLKEVKDWAISRERYWGTPLPIWTDPEGNYRVIGSVEDIKKYSKKSGNTYHVMRHGQTQSNVDKLWSTDIHTKDPLTQEGEAQVQASVKEYKKTIGSDQIDLIIVSPFARTQETAHIVVKELGLPEGSIITDPRLSEWNVGSMFDRKNIEEYFALRNTRINRYAFAAEGGESYIDVMARAGDFLYSLEKKYAGKNILIVTHGAPARALCAVSEGLSHERLTSHSHTFKNFVNAEIRQIDFVPLPHNRHFELDLHKPFIDEIELVDEKGNSLTRVKEVLDVWFDSGSMPFAQDHYPFEGKELVYPADFISEAIDQTRGWFYTLHAIGVLMEEGKAYKNVVCLGHILDAEGKKMSKSIGNIVNPWDLMDKYGVDALRLWMYSVNQPGDSKNFDEKTVDEIVKKVFNPLKNILSFYHMYTTEGGDYTVYTPSSHVLDQWIVARLNEMLLSGTQSLENYRIFEAARLIRDFVADFSTWYVRRSRERFKSDDLKEKYEALSTTRFVLIQLATYMAPFTPFFAEDVYQALKNSQDKESVHLCQWPKVEVPDTELIDLMQHVRETVTHALEARSNAGIKVRQPLGRLSVNYEYSPELASIIAEEVNVKEVVVDSTLGSPLFLDTHVSPELVREGVARDFIRAIQDARKKENLVPSQMISVSVAGTNEDIRKTIGEWMNMIIRPTGVTHITFSEDAGTHACTLGDVAVSFSLLY